MCCTPFGDDWRWFVQDLTAPDVSWVFFSDKAKYAWQHWLQRPNINTPVAGFRSALAARRGRAPLLVSIDPRLSFWCALFCRLMRVKAEHLAFSFNFPTLPRGWKRRLFSFAYRRLDGLRVHSSLEKQLYSAHFGIPDERIRVALWSMNAPDAAPGSPMHSGAYISAVGGNARDYETLLEAGRRLPEAPMVWVVRPENVKGLTLPSWIHVLTDIPYREAMHIVQHSRFTVVPLKGARVPCGHVTLVSAMLLRKAIVATDSAGISDYVKDGWNGLLCRPRDPGDLAAKLHELWRDPEKARRLGANGYRFAEERCSESSVRAEMTLFLEQRGLAARAGQKAALPEEAHLTTGRQTR